MNDYIRAWILVESLLDDISEDRDWFWAVFWEDPDAAADELEVSVDLLFRWLQFQEEQLDKWFQGMLRHPFFF